MIFEKYLNSLEIFDFEKQDLEQINKGQEEFTLPTHCHVISYTVSPDIDRRNLMVRDTEDSDQPIKRATPQRDMSPEAAAIGIIGGADGPVAVFATPRKKQHFSPTAKNYVEVAMPRAATSSLHFEPRDHVKWQIQIKTKQREDIEISLI